MFCRWPLPWREYGQSLNLSGIARQAWRYFHYLINDIQKEIFFSSKLKVSWYFELSSVLRALPL